jgi:iron complex transport system ATP-binding protein
MSAVFEVIGLDFKYPRAPVPAVHDLTWRVEASSVHAVIGPNGSGKSTLLRLLLGALRPSAGRVVFAGEEVRRWPRRELARRIGVVAQAEEIQFPITVRELVAMGRYPHLGPWRRAGREDEAAIERALQRCEVADLAHRSVATLSGGERQRARLARALAQEPATLVLDEPTASLDIAHEMTMFELLAALASGDGATIVVVTHHLNLAARYADRLLLLDGGRAVADGPPRDVLTRDLIERTYDWPVNVVAHRGPGPDTGAPQVVPLARASLKSPSQPVDTGDRFE